MSQAPSPSLSPALSRSLSQPRAVVFACRWCALIGADRAGREHLALPPFFRVIPVECAGAVEPDLILRALADGLDGVAVLGCHLGGCRHDEANREAEARLEILGDLLEAVGLDRRRLLLSWGTAHEAPQFAGLMEDFAAVLAALPRPAPLLDLGEPGLAGPLADRTEEVAPC